MAQLADPGPPALDGSGEVALREVVRIRLLDELDAGPTLTVLEGLDGAGKRTLLRQWVARPGAVRKVLIDLDPAVRQEAALLVQTLAALEREGFAVNPGHYHAAITADGPAARAEVMAAAITDLDEPVALVYLGLESMPRQAASGLPRLHLRFPQLRVLIEVTDATRAVDRATRAGVPAWVLRDRQLHFAPEEVAELMAPLTTDATAAQNLWRVSGGHPGLVSAALRRLPEECAHGRITKAQMVGCWAPRDGRPQGVHRFIADLSRVPAFALADAADLSGLERGETMARRLAELGLGEVRTDDDSGLSTFFWDRLVRLRTGQLLPADPEALDRIAAVARTRGDVRLQFHCLLQAGRLEEADVLASQWLWDLSRSDPDWWVKVREMSWNDLQEWPSLQLLRLLTAGPVVAVSAADWANRMMAERVDAPQLRHRRLAYAARAAALAGDMEASAEAARRWCDLGGSLRIVLTVGAAAAMAEGLLIVETLLQLDQVDRAASVASVLLDTLDLSGVLADPHGHRRQLLVRVVSAAAAIEGHRLALLGSIGSVESLVREPVDSVLVALNEGWRLLDGGEPEAGARVLRQAVESVPHPELWPVLMGVWVASLVSAGDRAGLEAVWRRYLARPTWRRRHFQAGRPGPIAVMLDALLLHALGSRAGLGAVTDVNSDTLSWTGLGAAVAVVLAEPDAPAPAVIAAARTGAVPVAGETLAAYPLRGEQLGLLMEALRALRAEEPALVDTALDVLAATGPCLAPLALGFASREEATQLADWAAGRGLTELAGVLGAAASRAGVLSGVPDVVALSEREKELLAHVRAGTTNTLIASAMFISVNTVKFHRSNLYRKLAASTREEALAAALRHGF